MCTVIPERIRDFIKLLDHGVYVTFREKPMVPIWPTVEYLVSMVPTPSYIFKKKLDGNIT